jgi:hypothetical protein
MAAMAPQVLAALRVERFPFAASGSSMRIEVMRIAVQNTVNTRTPEPPAGRWNQAVRHPHRERASLIVTAAIETEAKVRIPSV